MAEETVDGLPCGGLMLVKRYRFCFLSTTISIVSHEKISHPFLLVLGPNDKTQRIAVPQIALVV
jgi:hypothetical protein